MMQKKKDKNSASSPKAIVPRDVENMEIDDLSAGWQPPAHAAAGGAQAYQHQHQHQQRVQLLQQAPVHRGQLPANLFAAPASPDLCACLSSCALLLTPFRCLQPRFAVRPATSSRRAGSRARSGPAPGAQSRTSRRAGSRQGSRALRGCARSCCELAAHALRVRARSVHAFLLSRCLNHAAARSLSSHTLISRWQLLFFASSHLPHLSARQIFFARQRAQRDRTRARTIRHARRTALARKPSVPQSRTP